MFSYDAVDLDFQSTAPLRVEVSATVGRPPREVFAAFADDPALWGDFFPGFGHAGSYQTPAPHGVGARRTVRMGGLRFDETVLAWDDDARWAFRIDRSQFPVFRAFVEDYSFQPHGHNETLLRWNIAAKPRAGTRVVAPLMPHILRPLLARAARNLERLSVRKPADPPAS